MEMRRFTSWDVRHYRKSDTWRLRMTAKEKTLQDAFHETLKDLYFAEKQSVKALKKSAKAAKAFQLKQAFEKHHDESMHQLERITQVFESIGKSPRAKSCEAIQGITAEMEEDLEDFGTTEAADAVLIGCAQTIEHYEIARYGLLKAWATQLGYTDAAKLLDQSLQEEKKADEILSSIAQKLNMPRSAMAA
jgi:ferritin-like metal-binding protein YciE